MSYYLSSEAVTIQVSDAGKTTEIIISDAYFIYVFKLSKKGDLVLLNEIF